MATRVPLVGIGLGLALLAGCRPSQTTLNGEGFGTSWRVTLEPAVDDPGVVRTAIDAEIARLDAVFSTWRPDSELARFNAAPPSGASGISRDLAVVVAAAEVVRDRTGGAFDIALGSGRIALASSPPLLAKRDPSVRLDCSALAKGYAIDQIGGLLRARGIDSFLIEFGGELLAAGRPWKVGLEMPLPRRGGVFETVALQGAVATSGEYKNPGHIVDPRGGAGGGLASVSVFHESAMWADAYATGLFVLGPGDAGRVASGEGLRALLVISDDSGGFRIERWGAF